MASFFYCGSCSQRYSTPRGLSIHLNRQNHVACTKERVALPLPLAVPSPELLSPSYPDASIDVSVSPSLDRTLNCRNSLPPIDYTIPDSSLFEKFHAHSASGFGTSFLDAQARSEINLLNILKGVPLKLYDEIIQWAHMSILSGVDFKKIKPQNRHSVLNKIKK